MRVVDGLAWIVRSLVSQKVRTGLTILGFAIGIAAMVLLSALGEGLRQFVLEEFTQFGSHILQVSPGKTETFGMSSILSTTRPLSIEDAVAIANMPDILQVVPVVAGTARVKAGGRARYTDVIGVGPDADKGWQLTMSNGVFLPRDDLSRARSFVVLGSKVKQELFGHSNPLGQSVHIGSHRFRVAGVTAPKGQLLGFDMDDIVYVPVSKGLQLFNRESLMEIDIYYQPTSSADLVVKKIKKLLIARHGMEDFTIVTQDEMLKTVDNILNILKYAAGALGAISLLVGAVGITTIMTITVTERTKEIGLLRALGGTRHQVRNLFFGEAVFLGLVGGFFGVAVIYILSVILFFTVPGLPIVLSPLLVTGALSASMLIGLIAGVRPAMNATRLSPIDALRAE